MPRYQIKLLRITNSNVEAADKKGVTPLEKPHLDCVVILQWHVTPIPYLEIHMPHYQIKTTVYPSQESKQQQIKKESPLLKNLTWIARSGFMFSRPQAQVTASTEPSAKPDRSSPSSTLASRLETPASVARFLSGFVGGTYRSESYVFSFDGYYVRGLNLEV